MILDDPNRQRQARRRAAACLGFSRPPPSRFPRSTGSLPFPHQRDRPRVAAAALTGRARRGSDGMRQNPSLSLADRECLASLPDCAHTGASPRSGCADRAARRRRPSEARVARHGCPRGSADADAALAAAGQRHAFSRCQADGEGHHGRGRPPIVGLARSGSRSSWIEADHW